MKKPAPDDASNAWLEKFMRGASSETKTPAFLPTPSPSEQKAAETTRVSRGMTEAATEERQAATATLRAARLGKEADARARAAQEPPKTKKDG